MNISRAGAGHVGVRTKAASARVIIACLNRGFGSRRMVGIGHPDHQEPSDDGHDQNGEQLLTNTVFGPAMEGLDVEGGCLVAVRGFHRPASKLGLPRGHESLDGGKGGGGGTADDPRAPIPAQQVVDEVVTIINGGDEALGIMALAGTIQPAVRVERFPQGVRSRQAILGAIDDKDREAQPGLFVGRRPEIVGEAHRIVITRSKAVQESLARALVTVLRWTASVPGYQPLRRAWRKKAPTLPSTP